MPKKQEEIGELLDSLQILSAEVSDLITSELFLSLKFRKRNYFVQAQIPLNIQLNFEILQYSLIYADPERSDDTMDWLEPRIRNTFEQMSKLQRDIKRNS